MCVSSKAGGALTVSYNPNAKETKKQDLASALSVLAEKEIGSAYDTIRAKGDAVLSGFARAAGSSGAVSNMTDLDRLRREGARADAVRSGMSAYYNGGYTPVKGGTLEQALALTDQSSEQTDPELENIRQLRLAVAKAPWGNPANAPLPARAVTPGTNAAAKAVETDAKRKMSAAAGSSGAGTSGGVSPALIPMLGKKKLLGM